MTKYFSYVILLISIPLSTVFSQKYTSIEKELLSLGFVDIMDCDSTYIIDLKYSSADNFTKEILYDSLQNPFLHPEANKKLCLAHNELKKRHPNYRFIIFDVARPLHIQKKMYEKVKNTPYKAYVASPENTGLHNYGMAVDLSIVDINTNQELDMGTPFDFFGSKAGIRNEQEQVDKGILTKEQLNNRLILREVMIYAGFSPILGEWWHFNAVSRELARINYRLIQ